MGAHVFRTEKETESWLEIETRVLSLPDGTTRPLTGFRLLWAIYDRLIRAGYTSEQFVRWALEEAQLHNSTFETAFTAVVGYVDEQTRPTS